MSSSGPFEPRRDPLRERRPDRSRLRGPGGRLRRQGARARPDRRSAGTRAPAHARLPRYPSTRRRLSTRRGGCAPATSASSTADNVLTMTGRSKEIINRGGEKISGREIEDLLSGHPEVVESAVVPAPHPAWASSPPRSCCFGASRWPTRSSPSTCAPPAWPPEDPAACGAPSTSCRGRRRAR